MLFRRWAIKVCIKYLILQKTHRSRKEGSIREFFFFKKESMCNEWNILLSEGIR